MADGVAVPVDLVHIVQVRHKEGEVALIPRCRIERQVQAIPGIAGVTGVPLLAPGPLCGELFPTRVVEGWRGPVGIVAQMKPPGTVEGATALPRPSILIPDADKGGTAGACPAASPVKNARKQEA
ncbi:hypothetical protein [Tunturiibacter gelidiferens]|uniref:hypothetical protein n=1 Tax=Tunturiibacter gelidiferens TaxID=3069689 RepID=UPI003D9BA8AD